MLYENFTGGITKNYGVVLENWPLPRFCSPGDISSKVELSILYCTFESGTTRFRRMGDEEFLAWQEAHFEAANMTTDDVIDKDDIVSPSLSHEGASETPEQPTSTPSTTQDISTQPVSTQPISTQPAMFDVC